MIDYIQAVEENVEIDEGISAIEQFLMTVYFETPISNKEVARRLLLPIPLVTAMKREFIKLDIVKQDKGISITSKGINYVENSLGYKNIDKALYQGLKNETLILEEVLSDELELLEKIFENRPTVNLAVDQAHCTFKTSMKRALMTINYNTLINKKILCVGDDDLVSISIGILLQKLFRGQDRSHTEIHVVDIDKRFLTFIEEIAQSLELPIFCHQTDLKHGMKRSLEEKFDCFFTDPPYTINGIELFLSRGITALKKKKGLPVFLSFAHKSYDDSHKLLSKVSDMGMSVHQIIPRFNRYEGASIIGNIGQMFTLFTTSFTSTSVDKNSVFSKVLYTREVKEAYRLKKQVV